MWESGFDFDIPILQISEILMDAKRYFLPLPVNQGDKESWHLKTGCKYLVISFKQRLA